MTFIHTYDFNNYMAFRHKRYFYKYLDSTSTCVLFPISKLIKGSYMEIKELEFLKWLGALELILIP